jgi:hypothetical protein
MKVEYIGKSKDNLTNWREYEIIKIDSDGDYIVKDDFLNEINEYQSKFEII